jgi:hypothetical protein
LHLLTDVVLLRLTTFAACVLMTTWFTGCFYVPPISAPVEDADSPPFVLEVERVRLIDLSQGGDVRFEVEQIYDRNPSETINYAFQFDTAFQIRTPSFSGAIGEDGSLVAAQDQTLSELTTYLRVETGVEFCSQPWRDVDDRPSAMRLILIDVIENPEGGTSANDPLADVEGLVVEISWRLEFVGVCP